MADQDNGGYMNYGDDGGSDFKRKADSKKDIRVSDDEDDGGKMSGKANEYFVKELLSERVQMDGKYPHADRLLQQGEFQESSPNQGHRLSVLLQNWPPPDRTGRCPIETCATWTFTTRSQSRSRLRCSCPSRSIQR